MIKLVKALLHPAFTSLRKDLLQIGFKHSADIVQVFLGIDLDCSDGIEGFIKDGDDAALFSKGRKRYRKLQHLIHVCTRHSRAGGRSINCFDH